MIPFRAAASGPEAPRRGTRSAGRGGDPGRWAAAGALRAGQGGQVLGQRGRVSGTQRDRGHRRQPLQFGQDRAEGVAAVQVIGAVGADDGDPLACPAHGLRNVSRSRVEASAQCRSSSTSSTGRGGRELGQQAQDRAEHLLAGHA